MKLVRISGELTVLGRNAAVRLLIDAEPKIKPHVYPKKENAPEVTGTQGNRISQPGKISLCYVRQAHPIR